MKTTSIRLFFLQNSNFQFTKTKQIKYMNLSTDQRCIVFVMLGFRWSNKTKCIHFPLGAYYFEEYFKIGGKRKCQI